MATEVWPSLYWFGVVLVYGGSLALAVHIAREEELIPYLAVRRSIAIACLATVWWAWSTQVVFASAQVVFLSSADMGDYPTGTMVGTIVCRYQIKYQ